MLVKKIKLLSLDITYRCSNDCLFCEIKDVRDIISKAKSFRELSFPEVKRILKQAKGVGVGVMILSGGEPFLRKDIFKIIDYSSEIKLPLMINTRHVFYEKDIPKLKKPALKRLWVSIDSHDRAMAEGFLGRKGYFDEYIDGVRLLIKNGIPTSVICVINKLNISDVDKLYAFLYELGVESVHPRSMSLPTLLAQDYPRRILDTCAPLVLSEEELEYLKERELAWSDRLTFAAGMAASEEADESRDELARCDPLNGRLLIRPDGKIVYCGLAHDLVICDLRKMSLKAFLSSKAFRKLVKPSRKDFKGTDCFKCEAFRQCNLVGRCYKESFRRYGKMLMPDYRLCDKYLRKRDSDG